MGSGNVKKFELKLGRTGLVIVVAGMAVLFCLSFMLGVRVGKNIDTYPERISSAPQRFLALFWRQAKVTGGQKIMESKEVQSGKSAMDLTFHNNLVGHKTPALQPQPVVKKKPDIAVVGDQNEAVSPQKEASAQKVTISEKPSTETKSKIKKVPATVPAGGALFLVHVASLKDKAKANQINKTVSALGYSSKVTKVNIKGKGTWYRVIATGFTTKDLAQSAAGKINQKVKTKCIIRLANPDEDKNQ